MYFMKSNIENLFKFRIVIPHNLARSHNFNTFQLQILIFEEI